MRRVRAITAFATAALATVAVSGCAGLPGAGEPSPSASAAQQNAADALRATVEKTTESTATVEVTMSGIAEMNATVATDPVGRRGTAEISMTAAGTSLSYEMVIIEDDVWVRFRDVPGMPDAWMHATADDLDAGGGLSNQILSGDLGGSQAMLDAAVDVERTEDGFTGRFDLRKSPTFNKQSAAMLGDRDTTVDFTATVDAEGRLHTLTIDMNSVMPGLGTMTTTYRAYGEPVTAEPPTGEIVELPDSLHGVI